MRLNEGTNRPTDSQGFFPFPNRLLLEGQRRPIALAVYAALAATPAIWIRRGKLGPFEVQASWVGLADMTGETVKKVRGALSWLTESGFLTCIEKGGSRRAATYRFKVQRAQKGGTVSPSAPTPYTNANGAEGREREQKGSKEGAKAARSNGNNCNGLLAYPHRVRAQNGAHVLKDFKTNTPPPHPPTGWRVLFLKMGTA